MAVFRHHWELSRFPRTPRVWWLVAVDAAQVLPHEWAFSFAELYRHMKQTNWFTVPAQLANEFKFGLRSLVRKPGHLAIAMLSLALGIGFNIVIFTVINGLVLQPLPFNGASRLAYVVKQHNTEGWITSPDREVVRVLSEEEEFFEVVEPYSSSTLTMLGGSEPRVVFAISVSETFMANFGVTPLLGRGFIPGDSDAAETSIVLSEHLWRSAFGEDRAIIGRTLEFEGEEYLVLGVVAGNFRMAMTGTPDAWMLHGEDPGQTAVLARLTPGTTIQAASSRAAAIGAGLEEQEGLSGEDWTEKVVAPPAFLGNEFTRTLWVLLAAVGLVFLIACSNLANLTLAKGLSRFQELGVRRALGASRLQVVRLFMVESAILSVMGGTLGLLLAHWGLSMVQRIRPAYVSALDFVTIGPRIWLAAFGISAIAAILFGLLPAFRLGGADFNPSLRSGSRFSSGTSGDRKARKALVAAEVALALPLTIAAGLMARTVYESTHQDFGIALDGLISADVPLPDDRYGDEGVRGAFWAQLSDGLEASQLIESFAVTSFAPPRFSILFGEPEVENLTLSGAAQAMVYTIPSPPGYLEMAGTAVLHGRSFVAEDASQDVVIVNEAFAKRFASGADAVGRRLKYAGESDNRWHTIVGVVQNVVGTAGADAADRIQIYSPTTSARGGKVLLRSGAPIEMVLPVLKSLVWAIDPEVPIRQMVSVRKNFMDIFGRQRFAATLFASFGLVGLLLSAIGIHGVVALSVNQRLPELGVRMVFGAKTGNLARTVLVDGLGPVVVGAMIGLGASVALVRLVPEGLVGTPHLDPAMTTGLTLSLLAVGALACLGPLIKAIRLDPATVLRSD